MHVEVVRASVTLIRHDIETSNVPGTPVSSRTSSPRSVDSIPSANCVSVTALTWIASDLPLPPLSHGDVAHSGRGFKPGPSCLSARASVMT